MARTQTVTILFCDLVASTERRARLGDDAFDEFSVRFLHALRAAVSEHHGREVKSAGDGLMVVFPESVADAVACAVAMHRAVEALDPDDPARLRVGISTGEVAQDGLDYSGMPIVEAARLEAAATPGQTLANAIVRSLVGTRRALRFRDVGELTLKGLAAPLSTVEVIDENVFEVRPAPTPRPPARRARRRAPIVVGAIAVVAALAAAAVATTRSDSGSRPRAVPTTVTTVPSGIVAPTSYTPTLERATCPPAVHDAEAKTTCATLVVPEDRSKPSGRKVRLLVTRAPARTPGATGVPTIDVCGCEDFGTSLARDSAELIHVAQRGFQDSDPMLACRGFAALHAEALSRPSDDQAELARRADALRSCHDQIVASGIDPGQYNYVEAARDLLDLMVALRIPRANFVAFEAASAEVFEVLRRVPHAVRSITLDNPSPPGRTLLSDPIGDLKAAFDRYGALCAAQPSCRRSFSDLAASWHAAYASAQAKPQLVSVANPTDAKAPKLEVLMDGRREADALGVALTDAGAYGVIASGITQTGAERIAASLVVQIDAFDLGAPWGAYMSYRCSYDFHTIDTDRLTLEARSLPDFVRSQDAEWQHWCGAWTVPDVSVALSRDLVSDVPALLFRGDVSPNGDPAWIPRVERGLSDAQAVVFPTLGIDLLADGPPCLSKLRRELLDDPTKDPATEASEASDCEKQSPRITFITPSN